MKVLKGLFFFLCIALLVSTVPADAKTINFAVVSDVHYTVITDNDNKKYSNAAKALHGFVDRANENDYDFVIFLGDNIDKSKPQNLKGFLNIIRHIDTPYYAEITLNKADKSLNGKTVWPYTLMRNKIINSLVSSPSFVCRDNLSPQHQIICESFILRMLDKISSRKYYLVYKNVKDNTKKSRELALKKEKFIESLSQCYIDRQCIQQEYKAYIDMLISFK